VLKATVERVLDRVRVSVILIDARDDVQVFSKSYDRYITATDLFDIRTDIARAIVSNLHATLSPEQSERLASQPTENLVAFQKYALGIQRMKRRTVDALAEATGLFGEAIALDSGFALAYAGLADSIRLHTLYSGADGESTLDEINSAIDRALELDARLGEAWASRAALQRSREGPEIALASFERALELSPNHATARHWYGDTLVALGRVEEGLAQMTQAQRLDPLSPIIAQELGKSLFSLNRFDAALAQFQTAVEIDPDSPGPYERIADMQRIVFGRLDEAVVWQLKGIARDPVEPMGSIFLGFMYLDLDDIDEAERWFERASKIAPPGFWLARAMREVVHLRRGEIDQSLDVARDTLSFFARAEFTLANLKSIDIRSGHPEQARARYVSAYPELFERGTTAIDGSHLGPAIDLASVLMETGETEQASELLDAALGFVRTDPSPLPGGHDIAEVRIHAIRGNTSEALAALDTAIAQGWRANWWFHLEHDSSLDALRSEPEFLTLVETVRSDMATQLAQVRALSAAGDLPVIPDPD
jgi:tetratricopeptide (TPR) repeat protein